MRRKQRRGRATAVRTLQQRVNQARLKSRAKILDAVGRLQARFPKARRFVSRTVAATGRPVVSCTGTIDLFKAALAADGAYRLRSNQAGWTAEEFGETYTPWTEVERALRVLTRDLLLRPVWHHSSGRVEAQVMLCVLAYALWKTLDHRAQQAKLPTWIHKPADPRYGPAVPKPRPMTPQVILRELATIKLGDIHLETTEGQQLVVSRVARPDVEPARLLAALKLQLPERLSPERLL